MYGPNTTHQFGQIRNQELEAEVARNRRGKAVKTAFSSNLASEPDRAKMIVVIMLIGAPLVALFLA